MLFELFFWLPFDDAITVFHKDTFTEKVQHFFQCLHFFRYFILSVCPNNFIFLYFFTLGFTLLSTFVYFTDSGGVNWLLSTWPCSSSLTIQPFLKFSKSGWKKKTQEKNNEKTFVWNSPEKINFGVQIFYMRDDLRSKYKNQPSQTKCCSSWPLILQNNKIKQNKNSPVARKTS